MPLIKKAPAIVTLEVKLEEPVKQLLEDMRASSKAAGSSLTRSSKESVAGPGLSQVEGTTSSASCWNSGEHSIRSEVKVMFRRILDSRNFWRACWP
jgi:hypothetical protein